MGRKIWLVLFVVVAIGGVFIALFKTEESQRIPEQGVDEESTQSPKSNEAGEFTVVAEDLDTPWEIGFLPDGDFLVTERQGTLRVVGKNPVSISVPGVAERGEGGLLGLALHPDYAFSKFIYLYFTTEKQERITNQVVRYKFDGKTLSDAKIIIEGIPGASVHNGGRIAFGPDERLYITTGDAGNSNLAQDTSSLAGKILRLQDDGVVSSDNPFGNAVFSYGHRNPQGLAWDNKGNLWSTEHGRSGALSGLDELNLVEEGKNYGWPVIQGDETKEGMETPVLHSGATTTWAPAGAAYRDGSIFFGGLRGQAVYQVILREKPDLKAHFSKEFGRTRAVRLGPDGMLYISISNRDGRGSPNPGDDKIIKINPSVFQ